MKEVKKDFFAWVCEMRQMLHHSHYIDFKFHNMDFELCHIYVDSWSGSYMFGCYKKDTLVAYGIPAREIFLDDSVLFNPVGYEEKKNS